MRENDEITGLFRSRLAGAEMTVREDVWEGTVGRGQEFAVGSEDISTAATVLLAIVGFMILYRISKPLNWMRWTILIGSIIAFIFCSTYLNQLFAISDMSRKCIMLLVVFSVATEPVLRYLSILVDSISSFYRKQKIFFLRKREARKAK